MKNKILKGSASEIPEKKEKKSRKQRKDIDLDMNNNPKDSYNFDDVSSLDSEDKQMNKKGGLKKPRKEKEARKKRAPKQ